MLAFDNLDSTERHHNLMFQAIEFAAKAHAGQYRKGTKIPYIIHPLSVAKILIDFDCTTEIIIAGILHDTLEDTIVTFADIVKLFGRHIARIVESVSEPDRSDTWENRKRYTIEHLKTAPTEVLLVSCADKLDNIRSTIDEFTRIGDAVWFRFNRPRKQQRWYNQSLADVFMSRIDGEPGATLFKQFDSEVKKFFG